jgi:5-hydroxyisourate hydrolase-like protein (transthyretin family)
VITSNISIGSAGSGSESWTVPYNQTTGTDYKIRVTSIKTGVYNDTSNANFTISPGPPITMTNPNGGQNWKQGSSQTIKWNYTGSPGSYVKVELLKGTAVNRVITSNASAGSGGSGSRGWTVPYNQATGTDYKIRVTSLKNVVYNDTSNTNFTISAGAPIAVTVPNGGEIWKRNTTHILKWNYTGSPGSYVKVELLKGTSINRIISSNTSIGSNGSGSRSWTILSTQTFGTDYKIRVTCLKNVAFNDTSNANFTISA